MDGGERRQTYPAGNRTPVVPVTNHPTNTQTSFMDIQLINYVAKTLIIQLPIQLRNLYFLTNVTNDVYLREDYDVRKAGSRASCRHVVQTPVGP
jgi:hypothetical protein